MNPSQVLRYKTKNICNLITQDSLGFGRFACTVLIDYCNYFSLSLTTPEVWPLLILDDEVMVQQISNFWLLLAMVHLIGRGCLAIQYIMLKTKIEKIQLKQNKSIVASSDLPLATLGMEMLSLIKVIRITINLNGPLKRYIASPTGFWGDRVW